MKKLDNYPIYVNHPGRWEDVRLRQRDHFVDQGDYHMMTWLDYTGKRLYEIMEDKNPRPESVAFENAVIQLLRLIGSTRIGKLLFDSLDKNEKYWIIPLDYLDRKECACAAYTFPGAPKERGGIRMYFNPTDFNRSAKKWKSGDDVLFHELVHAYRMSSVGYDTVNAARSMNENEDTEEFFALQMQNIYLTQRKATRYYRTYKYLDSVSKDRAYQSVASDSEVLMVLRYYLDSDDLAKAVARWMHPPESFNLFRDHPVLERMYINQVGVAGMTRLPPW
jgi:hypothetical protein